MMRTPPANAMRWTSIALIVLGLFLIYLGWNGAAGAEAAVDLRAQFPYLISGGLFGLGLVGAGLTLVRVLEARKDSQAVVRQLEVLTAAVEGLAAAQAAAHVVDTPAHQSPVHAPVPAPMPVGSGFEPAH